MKSQMISIVMPSLNQADFIRQSIASVFNQSHENIELIVMDGGSRDDTVAILMAESAKDPRLKWISQHDSGPAEAISNGFKRVRGQIVGWLNSDDLFTECAFSKVTAAFQENPEWILCYGHGEFIDASGASLGTYPTRKPSAGVEGFADGCFICQPTVFFKTPLLTMLGPLNAKLRTAFDYDYWIRSFKAFPDRIGFIEAKIAKSRLHANCITRRERMLVALEGLMLGDKHFGAARIHWATTYLEELKKLKSDSSYSEAAMAFLSEAEHFLNEKQLANLSKAIEGSTN